LANDLRLVLVAGEPALANAAAKDLIGAQAPHCWQQLCDR
jgi:hypothetical protein